jgi:hypothetical protein
MSTQSTPSALSSPVPQCCEKNKVKITQKPIISTNHIFQKKQGQNHPKTNHINQSYLPKKTRSKSPKNQMPRNIFHAVPRWHLCWLIWRRRDGIPAKMQSFSFEPQRNGSRKLMLKLMN